MNYIKIRFSDDLDQSMPGLDKAIDEMFRSMSPMFSLSEQNWKPPMDIYETPEEIIVLAAVGGVEKDDLELEINPRAVKISGRRNIVFPGKDVRFCLAEIQYGTFERILFLPSPIDPEVVSASYTNGLLQVRMAKKPVDKPRKIPITEGS